MIKNNILFALILAVFPSLALAASPSKSPWDPWPAGESQPPNFWPAADDFGPTLQAQKLNRAFPENMIKSAANYDKATAGDPMFSDKTLWPMLGGKEYFLKEAWPKTRTLVWAKPGTAGNPKSRKPEDLVVTDPKNWLEDGKPATSLWDQDTDLVLPPAEKQYELSFRDCGTKQIYRHITVGRNAALTGGGDGVGRQIFGNVWIKRGGSIGSQGSTGFLGKQHVFYRNDNDEHGGDTQYYGFDKQDNRSIEFIGTNGTGDEFGINGCMVIIGQDSRMTPGRDAEPRITKGGTLVLMDGAYFGNWIDNFGHVDLNVEGNVWGGLPERPLTRNCVWALSFKNFTSAGFTNSQGKVTPYGRVVSARIHPGGSLKSFSAVGANAGHLVVTSMGEQVSALGARDLPGSYGWVFEREKASQYPDRIDRYAWFDKLPRGLDIAIEKSVVVENVEFDHFRKGGIMVDDIAAAQKWKGVQYGKHNLTSKDALLAPLPKLGKNGSY